jgi:2',3'-cyclic-nucleotide 2'-phosphodiesterase (5'-nucleotidase family)
MDSTSRVRMKIRRILLLLGLACAGAFAGPEQLKSLTILHANDLHARLRPSDDGSGGFAYFAAVIRRARANCNDCLLLSAGDIVQGSPVSTIFHGLPAFEITNLFGFDAGTLGNHEFDYGWRQARRFLETANYPIVCSNLTDDHGRLFTKQPYTILNANGIRVAVIGAMTNDLGALTTPVARGPWRTTPLIDTVAAQVTEARKKSDLVVILAHVTEEEEGALLRLGPNAPVIISGHGHKGLPAPNSLDGRVLVRVKAYGLELGKLKLTVDLEKKSVASWKWERIPVDARSIEPAADVQAQVVRWEDRVSKVVDKPLAKSERKFSNAEVKTLIERAMRDETGADFAFMNVGGVRDSLPQGQLLVRHIWNVMPFDNEVVLARVPGSQLPPVVTVGKTIDPNHMYTLATSDFTAANQSAHGQLETHGLRFSAVGPLLRDVLLNWIRRQAVLR